MFSIQVPSIEKSSDQNIQTFMLHIKKFIDLLIIVAFSIFHIQISCYYYHTKNLRISLYGLLTLYIYFAERSKKDELLSHMHKVSAIVPPKQILCNVVEYMKNTRNALRGELVSNKNVVKLH